MTVKKEEVNAEEMQTDESSAKETEPALNDRSAGLNEAEKQAIEKFEDNLLEDADADSADTAAEQEEVPEDGLEIEDLDGEMPIPVELSRKQKKAAKKRIEDERKASGNESPGKKRARKIRRVIALAVVAAIVVFFVYRSLLPEPLPVVMTTQVVRGDVESILSSSGFVESKKEKVYFSAITGDVSTVNISAGDAVKTGDLLMSYDEKVLSDNKLKAQLEARASEDSYHKSVTESAEKKGKLDEANMTLPGLEAQIAQYEAYIKAVDIELEELKNSKLQSLYGTEMSLTEEANEQALKAESYTRDSVSGNRLKDLKEEQKDTQNSLTANAYYQKILDQSADLIDLQRKLDNANEILTDLKEQKTEMKSQKESSEVGVLNSYAQSELDATNKLKQLQAGQTVLDVTTALNGVAADFDGIVTEVTAVQGSIVQEGGELLKLVSNQDVSVKISLTKYDLEKIELGQKADITIAGYTYEGELTKINRMAKKNDQGTTVVDAEITVTNPDENIYLGIEAKVMLHTAKAENILMLPVEIINADNKGDFVYIVENGTVVKRNVVTGVTSDTYAEIVEGLTGDEQLLAMVTPAIQEGMQVTAVPAGAAAMMPQAGEAAETASETQTEETETGTRVQTDVGLETEAAATEASEAEGLPETEEPVKTGAGEANAVKAE